MFQVILTFVLLFFSSLAFSSTMTSTGWNWEMAEVSVALVVAIGGALGIMWRTQTSRIMESEKEIIRLEGKIDGLSSKDQDIGYRLVSVDEKMESIGLQLSAIQTNLAEFKGRESVWNKRG